jgi:hypothetical protein
MNVASAFQPHTMPPNALSVRCHVLLADKAQLLEDYMVEQIPNCYIHRRQLKERKKETGLSASEILSNKLPDAGSVMSGEFGEMLTLFFLDSERTEKTVSVRKWRYKQDRKKPAPHSDVIILHRQDVQGLSPDDFVICAEAKQKATKSEFDPITQALEGFLKDRTGRLARTLLWLREKAIDAESRSMIEYIERFNQAQKVSFKKNYKAVAVVDRALLNDEITRNLSLPVQNDSFEIVVLGVNKLYKMYNDAYKRAINEVGDE